MVVVEESYLSVSCPFAAAAAVDVMVLVTFQISFEPHFLYSSHLTTYRPVYPHPPHTCTHRLCFAESSTVHTRRSGSVHFRQTCQHNNHTLLQVQERASWSNDVP